MLYYPIQYKHISIMYTSMLYHPIQYKHFSIMYTSILYYPIQYQDFSITVYTSPAPLISCKSTAHTTLLLARPCSLQGRIIGKCSYQNNIMSTHHPVDTVPLCT